MKSMWSFSKLYLCMKPSGIQLHSAVGMIMETQLRSSEIFPRSMTSRWFCIILFSFSTKYGFNLGIAFPMIRIDNLALSIQ